MNKKQETNAFVKECITEALLKLMNEKEISDITITELVERAGVARASFYRNFNSIGDVIDLIVDELYEELIVDILPLLNGTDERLWREFLFEYFYRISRHKREMSEIGLRNISVIFSRMDQKLKQIEELDMENNIRNKYLPRGKMALINGITKKWIDSGMKETPEEMIDFIMTFILF